MTEGRKWTQEEKQGEMAERKWRKGGGGGDGNRGGRNEGGQRLRKRIREGKGQGQVKKKKRRGGIKEAQIGIKLYFCCLYMQLKLFSASIKISQVYNPSTVCL